MKDKPETIFIIYVIVGTSVCIVFFLGLLGFIINSTWQNSILKPYPKFPYSLDWEFVAQDPIISSPIVDGTKIILQTEKSVLCLDGNSGKKLWISLIPGKRLVGSQMSVGDGVVVIAKADGQVMAFSSENGNQLWIDQPTVKRNVSQIPDNHDVASIVISNNNVFVARYSSDLRAFRLKDGTKLWEQSVSDRASLFLAVNFTTVFMSAQHDVDAINIETGQLLWKRNFGTNYISSLLVEGSTIYIWGDKSVQAMDIPSQQIVWSRSWASLHSGKFYNMVLMNNTIYIGGDSLYAFSKLDGNLLWKSKQEGDFGVPAILGDRIIAKDGESQLFIFNSKTGSIEGFLNFYWSQFQLSPFSIGYRNPSTIGDTLIIPIGSYQIKKYKP